MSINLNQLPYWDDYDETKKFHKVLFKPGFAVQGRELTQLQTILQKQVTRFGEHVFKEGSIVSGGNFNIENDIGYVKLQDTSNTGSAYDVNDFLGEFVTGTTSGITAIVVNVADGVQTETNTKTLFVRYLTGSDTLSTFIDGELLSSNTVNTSLIASNATGIGSIFTIEPGIIFSKGYFLSFDKQSVILSRYSDNPTNKVGFLINESIVDYISDSSLLDNAQGEPNFSAPGADRLKVTPLLVSLAINDPITLPEFVEMFTIQEGVVQTLYQEPQYNVIRNEIAKRTFDESGDYVVSGLGIRVREHLNVNENEGLLTLAEGGDSNLLSVGIEPGLAYVKGFDVSTLVTTNITTEKSIDFEFVNSQITPARIGNYIIINEVTGALSLDRGTTIQLYDTAQQRLTSNAWSTGVQSGNLIGTAKVKGTQYESGTLGTPEGKLRLYLYDINMTNNQFSDVRSIYLTNTTTANVGADVVLVSNNAILEEPTETTLLFSVGSKAVRSIRDTQGNSDTTFTFKRTQNVTIGTSGTFSVSLAIAGEAFPYGTTPTDIGTTEKKEILLNFNEDKSILLSGTVSGSSGANTVTGSSTSFTDLNVGDKIEIADVVGTFYIKTIVDDENLVITETLPSTFSTKAISKVYKEGDIIDLTTKGADSGVIRTVTPSGGTSTVLNFDLKESFASTVSATVTTKIVRSSAIQINKQLRPNRFVKIDCSSLASLTAPINLGVSNVFQIRQIRKDTSAFTTSSQGTDVTSSFIFDNGQRDELYDHASIIPKITLSASEYLLVELDYFQPDFSQGVGYFSVDSYPVNDTVESSTTIFTHEIPIFRSPDTNIPYDLRDFLDFRPVKTNTATDSTTVSGASTNPSVGTTFVLEGNGQRLPIPSSQILVDYSYFLSRVDVVGVDKDGNFLVVKGTPSINPVIPSAPDSTMVLGTINIEPYPSLSPAYARKLGRTDLECTIKRSVYERFTMRDIGILKKRIENLEYFASLNALERDALNMIIPDTNGLDRFKNGIFVDNFSDHSLGATYNPDYNIVIDKLEKSIRPVYDMESFDYEYQSGTNIQKTGSLITLPYTEVEFLSQNNVSTIRNIEQSVYRFIGNLVLSPENDVWVDTETVDRSITIGGEIDPRFDTGLKTEWDSWQTIVTGYNLYNATTGELLGAVSNLSTAQSEASKIAGPVQVKNNTIGYRGPNVSVRIEEVSVKSRTGTENYSGILTDTKQLGNFVTDVRLIPYIRPQVIQIYGRGLKPNTRFYTFFDGERMTEYVTPTNSSYIKIANEGGALVSNADGEVYGLLRLPSTGKRFRVGTKEVVVTDSPTNAPDASSSAENYFVSQGLIQQKQNTIVTTRQVIVKSREVEEIQNISTVKGNVNRRNSSCLGYSFFVNVPENEQGIFLTSVDVFIQASHPTLGCWFEIREMNSAGGITRNQVPFSEVWIERDDPAYVLTEDGTVPTKVRFPTPVFLNNKTQYAFIVHTIGLNPDTYFWVSRLGETDILTNQPITSRPLTGTLYTTNNNLNWVPVLDLDLKIKFHRANFNTNVSGVVNFGNKSTDFLEVNPGNSTFSFLGETFTGKDQVSLVNFTGGIAEVTDKLVGQTSGANGSIVSISGNVYRTSNTGYLNNETVNVLYANNVLKGVTANISGVVRGEGNLYRYDTSNSILYITNSNGQFYNGDVITGSLSGNTATITGFSQYKYNLFDFEPNFITYNNTTCTFQARTTNQNNLLDNFFDVNVRNNNDMANEKRILSRSQEVSLLSGQSSSQFRATLNTTSSYVSPVVDDVRTHAVYIQNIINSDDTGETDSSGGNLVNKYISKTVTLADGQDAEDLAVFITAYRPAGTEIKIYAKLKNANDTETFDLKEWTEMERVGENVFSSNADKNNFISYDFKLPDSVLTGTNGEVQYTSSGLTFTGYKQFAIKIALLSDNSSLIPRVADLRTIALQI